MESMSTCDQGYAGGCCVELSRCTGRHDGKLTCWEVLLVRAIHAHCSVHVVVAILVPVMRLPNRLAAGSAQILQVG